MKRQTYPYPWMPDQGDGTYRNPVLHADYSDPDAVRVGEDYYLTASSFNCTPGLPILHSRDLVNWNLVNHALKALPDPRYAEVHPGHGVWAPAIRFHAGKFWIVFPTPDEGIYVITADDPAGDWSEPHLLLGGNGLIDPCPFWDDDGKAYLAHAYAGSRAGIRNKLHVRPMSPDGREILGEGKVVAEIDPELPALEGPKVHKRNDWYYISAPAGGVATGWQSIFRARDIFGPYEERIVLAQRGTEVNGPHQGALVDTPGGEWWFLHFQEKVPYGRIVHLQPMRWEDDWPLIGEAQDADGVGRPVERFRMPVATSGAATIPQDSDDFSGDVLGLQWQWNANPGAGWYSLTERPGFLRLFARPAPNGDPSMAPHVLSQKFPASEFAVAARMELPSWSGDTRAGLVVLGRDWAALDLRRAEDHYAIRLQVAGEVAAETVCRDPGVVLKVLVGPGGACRFGIETSTSAFEPLGPAFQAVAGVWIGAKVGLYSIGGSGEDEAGHVDCEWFRVQALDEQVGWRVPDQEGQAGVNGLRSRSARADHRAASPRDVGARNTTQ